MEYFVESLRCLTLECHKDDSKQQLYTEYSSMFPKPTTLVPSSPSAILLCNFNRSRTPSTRHRNISTPIQSLPFCHGHRRSSALVNDFPGQSMHSRNAY